MESVCPIHAGFGLRFCENLWHDLNLCDRFRRYPLWLRLGLGRLWRRRCRLGGSFN